MPVVERLCKNCGASHYPHETCLVHWEARLTGHEDAQTGSPRHAGEWPQGRYGHADYWVGFYGGDKKSG